MNLFSSSVITMRIQNPETSLAHLWQECQNSKFRIFEFLVLKETFADALLTCIVS